MVQAITRKDRIKAKSLEPSPFQQAILDYYAPGNIAKAGNMLVNATAGSGKTSLLRMLAQQIDQNGMGSMIYLAFNREIVAEVEPKLSPTGCVVKTFHGWGMSAIAKVYNNVKVDSNGGKYKELWFGLTSKLPSSILKVVVKQLTLGRAMKFLGMLRINGWGLESWDFQDFRDIMAHPSLDMEDFDDEWLDSPVAELVSMTEPDTNGMVLAQLFQGIIEAGMENLALIDFTDMLYAPAYHQMVMPRYDFFLCDEVQDFSFLMQRLLSQVSGNSKFVLVGDRCQPEGTMVRAIKGRMDTANGHGREYIDVPIESLQVGDWVHSYCAENCAFYSRQVTGITKRPYQGKTFVVTVAGNTTEYTPNHYCLASFNSFRGHVFVYLMRKGKQYRIGICTLYDSPTNSGLRQRLYNEDGDAIWILKVFKDRDEAWMWEQYLSTKFGIPQMIFNGVRAKVKDPALMDAFWEMVGDNSAQGESCLYEFDRYPEHPLFVKGGHNQSLKRPIKVHASNLMTGCLMLPMPEKGKHKTKFSYQGFAARKSDWKVATVSTSYYNGFVYSLNVEGLHTYVADNIVTHNCQAIYAFSGADEHSYDNMQRQFDAVEFPLSVCYRCPDQVLDLARRYVPHIEGTGKQGTVLSVDLYQAIAMMQAGDLYLSRTNAPLVKLYFGLVSKEIPAAIKGRDYLEFMRKFFDLMEKFDGSLEDALEDAYHTKTAKMDVDDPRFNLYCDVRDCVEVILNTKKFASMSELRIFADTMFSAEAVKNGITLSSIHRSKGLENPRVFVYEGKSGLSQPDMGQESNLVYVAYTRAQETLVLVRHSDN